MSIGGTLLGEKLHDLGVQLGHHDLDSLVGLHVGPSGQELVQRIERVQVPAISVQRPQAISRAVREHFIQKCNFLLETAMRLQLKIGPLEVFPRVEKVLGKNGFYGLRASPKNSLFKYLNGIKSSVLLGHIHEISNAFKWSRCSACLENKPPLGHEHGAFTQNIGVHLAILGH